MKKGLLFVAATIWAVHTFSATTYTVSSNGTNSGTSWTTVKAAITAAASGDIIQVAAGTFTEKNITLNAVKSLTIQGAGMNQTVIQADASTTIAQASDCGVFKLDAAYTSGITITIKDMTIQNGYNSFSGGGIRFVNTGTQADAPTLNLANLKISANRGSYGGGVYIQGAALLTLNGCYVTGNSQTTTTSNIGGGIGVTPGTGYVATVTIKNSTISGNSSVGNGGGVAIVCGSNGATAAANYLWIENSTIYGNSISTSAKIGGGVYFKTCASGQSSVPTFTLTMNHCTVVSNTTNAGTGGDGVCIENGGGYATTVAMNNSIIIGNSGSTSNASQIGVNNASISGNSKITASPVITNSIFGIIASGTWATTTTHNNLTASIGDLAFAGSLSSDATPVLLIGSGSAAKDYVATNSLSPALSIDQIGNPRSGNTDAGAYEYNASLAIAASATSGGSVTSGTGSFASGASTTLVATPSGSNAFANWTENGVIVSTNASYTFTVTKARTLVANFTVQYNVQTANDGNGSVSGAATVASGNPVTLTATPNAGYAFSAWIVTAGTTPSISTTTNPLTFTPSADCTISASFVSITALTPTVTYARTASTIDVLVTNPTGYTGTLTYKVLDGSNNILATGVSSTTLPQTSTLAYSATGLSANSSYTYKVVAVINGTINSATASIAALTRKHANGSVQVIDDFEDGNALGWINQSAATLTIPYTNNITGGINTSTNCAKANILSGKNNFSGFMNNYERIQVGPSAPYQYLHIKMYRDADNGTVGLTFSGRNDIAQVQQTAAETPAVSVVSASGPWVDYVFDLKNAAYTSDKTYFGFYFKPNKTTSTTNVESNSYIDDVYLSNDATISTSNITIPVTISAGTGGTVSQTSNTYLSSDNATVVATPNSGYHFVNWTLNTSGGTVQSTSASYSFTVSTSRTLVANFEPNNVAISSGTTNAADITCTTCDVTVASDAELTVGSTQTLKSVTVAAGGKITINAGTLSVTNGISLESDASGTATLMDTYSTPTINAIVKQYVTAGRNWYMSAPLNNTADYSVLDKGVSVIEYNETTGLWPTVSSGTLMRGKGYVQVASATQGVTGTVLFSGTTNSGDVPVTLTYTSDKGKGFNLVGNPYPSYISWSAVVADNAAANMPTGTMWYRTISYNGKSAWTPNTVYNLNDIVYNGTRFYKVTTAGTSAALDGPSGTTTGITDNTVVWDYQGSIYIFATVSASGVTSPATVSNLVPPMQAFWVKSTGGTLTFKNSMRSHNAGATNALKSPKKSSNDMQLLRLKVTNGASTDEAVIYTSTDASNSFDTFDAPKYFNIASNQPEIYTQVGNEKLVINAMKEINTGTEIPVGFNTEKGNNFTIFANELKNFSSDIQVVLQDKLLDREFDLSTGNGYEFTSSIVNDANRFSLLFKSKSTTTGFDKYEKQNIQVFVNSENQITIIAPEKATYIIYNELGQKISTGITVANRTVINGINSSGAYVVHVLVKGCTSLNRVLLNNE